MWLWHHGKRNCSYKLAGHLRGCNLQVVVTFCQDRRVAGERWGASISSGQGLKSPPHQLSQTPARVFQWTIRSLVKSLQDSQKLPSFFSQQSTSEVLWCHCWSQLRCDPTQALCHSLVHGTNRRLTSLTSTVEQNGCCGSDEVADDSKGVCTWQRVFLNIVCVCACVCEGGYVSKTAAEIRCHNERGIERGDRSPARALLICVTSMDVRRLSAAASLRRLSNKQGFGGVLLFLASHNVALENVQHFTPGSSNFCYTSGFVSQLE